MGAGRTGEGIPFLIDGAAEAIQQGAPHEAERALRTGLPSVPPGLKTKAIILLATALQEQAAWQDLLAALQLLPEDVCDDVRAEALALEIKARRQLGGVDTHEIQHDLDILLSVASSAHHPAIRVRAVTVAATLSNCTRKREQAHYAYELAKAVPEAELQAHDRAALDCARAQLAFQLGDSQASIRHLEAAAAVTSATGLASSIAARVHMGLG